MDIRAWNDRYRLEDPDREPAALVVKTLSDAPPGKALDVACGTGRNAIWLAEQGWSVTAVDGAPAAIESLRKQASAQALQVDARVADLEKKEYSIEPSAWDLIIIIVCYYLQRDLFKPARLGVKPAGLLIAIAHITEPGEEPNYKRLRPGELETYFPDWQILHRYEGKPRDSAHRRSVAEIVARRPMNP